MEWRLTVVRGAWGAVGEGWEDGLENATSRREQEASEEEGLVWGVCLQSSEAGAPRHWHLVEGNVDHELVS